MLLRNNNSAIILIILSTILLTAGFYNNAWKAADKTSFPIFQKASEALIYGRLVKSRRDGILSVGGLAGYVHTSPQEELPAEKDWMTNHQDVYDFQYDTYYKNTDFNSYLAYRTQIAFQGIIYSLYDSLNAISNIQTIKNLRFFNSFLFGLAISLIVAWFYREFGITSALFVLLSTMYSQWMTLFGNNLWWSMWAFYLPFLASLYILKNKNRKTFQELSIIFVAVFVKCLFNGYEYISTALLMMVTPYVYYAIYESWGFKQFFIRTSKIALVSILSIFATTLILAYQISTITGSYEKGLKHIYVYSLAKRSHGSVENNYKIYRRSLSADTINVAGQYLTNSEAINLNNLFNHGKYNNKIFEIKYLYIVILLAFISVLTLFLTKYRDKIYTHKALYNIKKLQSLTLTTWFSIFAPFSWFLIFKGHSAIHYHMNYITWHMPFVLFFFGLLGFIAAKIFNIKLVGTNDLNQ